jgi:formamidopyrimidine-DNA glycosylase
MPELPEVETMCRGIAAVAGQMIHTVRFPKSHLCDIEMSPGKRAFRRRVEGHCVVCVRRVAKRVVIDLDSKGSVVFEPRMTGRVLLAEPPDRDHVRAVFEFADADRPPLTFWSMRGLSTLHCYSREQLAAVIGPDRIGPDALGVTADHLQQRLRTSRRAIKVALLDQKVVAGIGNIYASEILHRARLHPETLCDRISRRSWQRIQAETVTVLGEAIQAKGSTLRDGNYRTASDEPGGFQDRHRVYGREGLGCLQCGRGAVRRIVQAQRSTYFCPVCQRTPRRS